LLSSCFLAAFKSMDQPANVLMAAVLGRLQLQVGNDSPLRENFEVAPLVVEAHCLPCRLPNVIKSQRFQLRSREGASTHVQHLEAQLETKVTIEQLKETRSLSKEWPPSQYLSEVYTSGQSTLLQKRIPPLTSSTEQEGKRKERAFGGSRKHGAVSAPAKDGLVGILPACKDGDAHAEHGLQASGHSGDLCAG
jgi:hypothetical protein